MKAMLLTVLIAAGAVAGTPPKPAARATPLAGCSLAVEFVRRFTTVELLPEHFDWFSPTVRIRLYAETSDGQDLGYKDLTLEEYRAFAGDLGRFQGRGPVNRYQRIRCEADGPNWLVTAERHAIHRNYVAPVTFVIGRQSGSIRILSAAYVQIVE